MKFNKAEIALLANQPSHKFDKEGVLFVREKQEGFFKKNEGGKTVGTSLMCVGGVGKVSVERWCRLRGNLLFYFRSRDHWSEPAGVIVLEAVVEVTEDNTGAVLDSGTFGFILNFSSGPSQYLSCFTQDERDSWKAAIEFASHTATRQRLKDLQDKVSKLKDTMTSSDDDEVTLDSTVIDPNTAPVLECSMSCDNLLCDALGRSPSARMMVYLRNSDQSSWKLYASTEVVERSSNPSFLVTVSFRHEHNVFIKKSQVRICVQDMRERLTMTKTTLGTAFTTLDKLSSSERVRLKLESPCQDSRGAGFVTVTSWSVERELGSSTRSTPSHAPSSSSLTRSNSRHVRSQSLPPAIQHRVQIPVQPNLLLLFTKPYQKTYKFHSGLGGDISVIETMMEPRISFIFPQQLLTLWISEERELVHEIAGVGELREPWHSCQMSWLENHLNLINNYNTALENLDNYRGSNFKRSAWKNDPTYEFVPTNLHLQRMWVQNESLRKSGFFDIQTVGAFSAHAQKTKSQGLMRMLKELKSPQKDSSAWCSLSDKLQMAEDCLSAIRKVRREVVDCMRLLMKLAKEKKSDGMFLIVEDMLKKTKLLCSICDTSIVEEALSFLEDNRVTVRPEKDEFSESVAEFMQRNKLKIDLKFKPLPGMSLQTPCSEFICSELQTPDVQDSNGRGYSVFTSGYQSVDTLSDIDEFEESFKCMSVEDKTRHYYTLFRDASPADSVDTTPVRMKHQQEDINNRNASQASGLNCDLDEENDMTLIVEEETIHETGENSTSESGAKLTMTNQAENISLVNSSWSADNLEKKLNVRIENDGNKTMQKICRNEELQENNENSDEQQQQSNKVDLGIVTDNEVSPHYKLGDEPEPIDLTHLNIEAAMMCLASKVRTVCGRADSPTLSNRTFRFKELETLKRSNQDNRQNTASFTIPDPQNPNSDELGNWAGEVRPSMRKLRQGMDSLLKTSRLMCSVLRLQQLKEAVKLTAEVKYRRDVCFSQALTSLVSALMSRLWCHPPDPVFLSVLTQIGPLVCFEGLLSMHGEDVPIYNDMIVAVEDLRSVEFTLVMVENKKPTHPQPSLCPPNVASISSFPLPRVTGARASLKVLLPVPDWVYTLLPLQNIKTMTFSITPVFFNIGINEKATIAEKLGYNLPQERNNSDNFKILLDYVRRFKKMNLFSAQEKKENNIRQFSAVNDETHIDDLMSILKNEVANKRNKNVDILSLSSQICLKLNGLRFTSCKSAKDRTGMSVTLEQVNILSREFDLAENEYQRALDAMRSEGTRRQNCLKNIESNKYAFTTVQLATFPKLYKPPVGTFGSKVT